MFFSEWIFEAVVCVFVASVLWAGRLNVQTEINALEFTHAMTAE